MHAVVLDRLEEYLAGALEPATLTKIELHLKTCATCREEVAGMQQISLWMSALKTEEQIAAPPGFYARVMQQVGDRKPLPTFSSLFSLDLAFGRRLAFACLLTLAVLGSYLVTRETRSEEHTSNSSHVEISYAVFCLKKKIKSQRITGNEQRTKIIEKKETVCSIEKCGKRFAYFQQVGFFLRRKSGTDVVHHVFGVGFAGKVTIFVIAQHLP